MTCTGRGWLRSTGTVMEVVVVVCRASYLMSFIFCNHSGHKVMGFTGAITHAVLLRICWPIKQWNSFLKICLSHQLGDDTQMVWISIFHDSVYNLINDNFMMLCTKKIDYNGLETKGRSRNGLLETSVPVIQRNLSPQLCKSWGASSQKRIFHQVTQ